MAIQKKENFIFAAFSTLAILALAATENVDCNGKAFYCVNSTHFKICVDIGGGVSKTVDDFLIPCPRNTACKDDNYFECELTTTLAAIQQSDATNDVGSSSTTPSNKVDMLTLFPEYNTRKEGELSNYQSSSLPVIKLSSTIEPALVTDLSSFTLLDETVYQVNLSVNYKNLSESVKNSYNEDSVKSAEIVSPTKVTLNITPYNTVPTSSDINVNGNLSFSDSISNTIDDTKSETYLVESLNNSATNETDYGNEVNSSKSPVAYSSISESTENSTFPLKTETIKSTLNDVKVTDSFPNNLNTDNFDTESSTLSFINIINNDSNIQTTEYPTNYVTNAFTITSDIDPHLNTEESIDDTKSNLTKHFNSSDLRKNLDNLANLDSKLSNANYKNPVNYSNSIETSVTPIIESSSINLITTLETHTEQYFTTNERTEVNTEDFNTITNAPTIIPTIENIVSDSQVTSDSNLVQSSELYVSLISHKNLSNPIETNNEPFVTTINNIHENTILPMKIEMTTIYSSNTNNYSDLNISLREPLDEETSIASVITNDNLSTPIEATTIALLKSNNSLDLDNFKKDSLQSSMADTDISTFLTIDKNLFTVTEPTTFVSSKPNNSSNVDIIERKSLDMTVPDLEISTVPVIHNDKNLSRLIETTTVASSSQALPGLDISNTEFSDVTITDLETPIISVINNDNILFTRIESSTFSLTKSNTFADVDINTSVANLETYNTVINDDESIPIESSTFASPISKSTSDVNISLRGPLNEPVGDIEKKSNIPNNNVDEYLFRIIETSITDLPKFNITSDIDTLERQSTELKEIDSDTNTIGNLENGNNFNTSNELSTISSTKSTTSTDIFDSKTEPSYSKIPSLEVTAIPVLINDTNLSTLSDTIRTVSLESTNSSDADIMIKGRSNSTLIELEALGNFVDEENYNKSNLINNTLVILQVTNDTTEPIIKEIAVDVINDENKLKNLSEANKSSSDNSYNDNKFMNTSQKNTNRLPDDSIMNTTAGIKTFIEPHYPSTGFINNMSDLQAKKNSEYIGMNQSMTDKNFSEIIKTEKQLLTDLNTLEKIHSETNSSNFTDIVTEQSYEKSYNKTTVHKESILNFDNGVQNYSTSIPDENVSSLSTIPLKSSSKSNNTIFIHNESVNSFLNVSDSNIKTTQTNNGDKILNSLSNNTVISAIVTEAPRPIYKQNLVSNRSYELDYGVKEMNAESNNRVIKTGGHGTMKISNVTTSNFDNITTNTANNTNFTGAFESISYVEPTSITKKQDTEDITKSISLDKDSSLYPNREISSKIVNNFLLSNPIETTLVKSLYNDSVINYNLTSNITNSSTTISSRYSNVENDFNELIGKTLDENKNFSHKIKSEDQNIGFILNKTHEEKPSDKPHKDIMSEQIIIKSNPITPLAPNHKQLESKLLDGNYKENDGIFTQLETNFQPKIDSSERNNHDSKIPSIDSGKKINNDFSQVTTQKLITTTDYANIESIKDSLKGEFTCANRLRGKYSDKINCNKFYICIGKPEPIIGMCPDGTVFSEIKKQCTNNFSHCIRNNQFRCLSTGRFIDVLSDQFFYICVMKLNGYIRYKLQCQKNYTLNKSNIQCSLDSHSNENISKTNSDNTTIETKSIETAQLEDEKIFECKKEGKFEYPDDCRKYYRCSKNSKSEFRRKIKKCDSEEVFDKEKMKCVDADSYEC